MGDEQVYFYRQNLGRGGHGLRLAGRQSLGLVYDFESFNDSTSLTQQLGGLSFGNATVLTAGISLNEIAFPPRSGSNVVFDDGGAITIDFSSSVFGVGGYFTYGAGLTFSIYDSSQQLLGSTVGLFSANLGDGTGDAGSSPNEYLSLADVSGQIARLVIAGNVSGASFTLDDLSVDVGNQLPEPTSLALALVALSAGYSRRCRAAPTPND